MNVKIFTDGGCDLSLGTMNKYDIELLPMLISDGNEEYCEHKDITVNEIFDNMKNGVVYSTSQVSISDCKDAFLKCAKEGIPAMYITLSSGISGSYSTACFVRDEVLNEYPDSKLYVIDSLCATSGLSLMVLRLAMEAQNGVSLDKLLEYAEFYRENTDHIWTVTTFDYLVRGGRVSKASATIGGLLNIKPVMELSKLNGKLLKLAKVHGEAKLYHKMCEEIIKRCDGNFDTDQTLVIGYGANEVMKNKMKKAIIEVLGMSEENIVEWQVGAIVGSHTGPDLVGCYYLKKTLKNGYDIISI